MKAIDSSTLDATPNTASRRWCVMKRPNAITVKHCRFGEAVLTPYLTLKEAEKLANWAVRMISYINQEKSK